MSINNEVDQQQLCESKRHFGPSCGVVQCLIVMRVGRVTLYGQATSVMHTREGIEVDACAATDYRNDNKKQQTLK